jgi:hypothetical protein
LGIGIIGGGGPVGGIGNVGLSLKVPALPIFWGVYLSMRGGDYFGLGVTGDYYFYDSPLVRNINLYWFLGLGGYVNLLFLKGNDDNSNDDDKLWFSAGARVPVGLSWRPVRFLEIFADIVPSLGAQIAPSTGFDFDINFELGLRLWL